MKQNRIRIGIIGTGQAGRAHLDIWKKLNETDIVGFYEPDDEAANGVTEKYQVPRFLHPDILLESCDAIDITASIQNRFEWCEKAIKIGKHVFTANPMTGTMAEARQLLMLVEESGIKCQVQATERFSPAISAIKHLPATPSFLEFRLQLPSAEANFKEDISDNHVFEGISLIQSIVKSDVKNISANTLHVLSEENDIINIRIEYQNGCVAVIYLSRVSTIAEKTIQLFYKDAAIDIDLLANKAEIIKVKEQRDLSVFAFEIQTAFESKTIITDNLFINKTNALQTELEEFRNAILLNTKTINSETDGWIAMDIVRQAMDKAGNNIFAK